MTTGAMIIMAPNGGIDLQGDALAQRVRALAARMRGSTAVPSELLHDVMETLSSAVRTVQMHEDRMQLVERAIHDVLWEWDCVEQRVHWNANVADLFGYEVDAIPPSIEWWKDHIHPDDRSHVVQTMETVFAVGKDVWADDYRFLLADGRYMLVRHRAFIRYGADEQPTHLIGAIQDVTLPRRTHDYLPLDALHDALTGLPNRQLFLDRLSLSFERVHRRTPQLFAVIFLDLDRFRNVNESYGHFIGDELLSAVVQRLDIQLRASDSFARLGSDEFAILVEDLQSREDAFDICRRIQTALTSPFRISRDDIFISGTMGIAFYEPTYHRPDELLRDATIAMSRARTVHPGSLMVFDAKMHAHALNRIRLESDLRQALERKEFVLHFQPIVTASQNAIVGAEALVRWNHPSRGMISPGDFIPLAEETGLIVPLGEWVLRTACAQAKVWHDEGHSSMYVSVNLSARQFKEQDIAEQVARILEETGLRAAYLHLELTESMISDDMDATIRMLMRLKETGVHLSVDDFGMGYSSLSYLQRFPISTIKIDHTFMREIQNNPHDAAIATAIIELAHSLELQVVAEGVETEEQLAFLQTHQCEAFQGFLCSPAVPANALNVLLRAPS